MRIIRTYARWLAVILPVSLALTLVVPAAASTGPTATLVLTSSNSAPTFGQSITLRATLTVSGSSQSTIGQYSIFDGSTPLISGAMANFVTGYAYATSSLSVGKHTLTAKYAGTVNGLKATSNAVIVQVSPDPLSITTKSLASGVVGTAYSAQLASSGGTGKVTWKLASGSSLVTGLTLSTAGAISGTPAAATSGTGSFTVIATDSASPAHTATAPIAYTINLPQAAKPTFTVAAGTYTSAQTVSIKDATAGATIYYTTNGNTPTTASTKYTGAITVSATETIKAIATATGHSTSAVASALYTINLPVARCSGDGSGNGKIKGAYAFQLSQTYPVHSGGLGFLVGGLTADGLGNLTGSVDMNSPFGPSTGASSTAFTGNYSVGSDNRGVLNVIVPKSGGGSETLTYCVALDSISSGVAAAGRMVENDTTSGNASSGAFYAQGSGNHSLSSAKGSWVFGLQGGTAASTGTYLYRSAMAGLLALDGAGKISSGQMDISVDATLDGSNIINASFHDIGLTGSYTIAANGRGVMTITVPSSNELGGEHPTSSSGWLGQTTFC